MRYGFLAARELNVCAKFQVSSSKTVAATLRTYTVHTDQNSPKSDVNTGVRYFGSLDPISPLLSNMFIYPSSIQVMIIYFTWQGLLNLAKIIY